jgi:hypothetical protein
MQNLKKNEKRKSKIKKIFKMPKHKDCDVPRAVNFVKNSKTDQNLSFNPNFHIELVRPTEFRHPQATFF